MSNYQNGKKLAAVGFGGLLLVNIVGLIVKQSGLLHILSFLAQLAIAGGFGLKYLERKNIWDLLTGGIVGISLVVSFLLSGLVNGSTVLTWCFSIFSASMYLTMALQARERNNMTFWTGLLFAFLYTGGGAALVFGLIGKIGLLQGVISIVSWLGYLLCNLIGFAYCSLED